MLLIPAFAEERIYCDDPDTFVFSYENPYCIFTDDKLKTVVGILSSLVSDNIILEPFPFYVTFGEELRIAGYVPETIQGEKVHLEVFLPDGLLLYEKNIPLYNEIFFGLSMNTQYNEWMQSGSYKIILTYGTYIRELFVDYRVPEPLPLIDVSFFKSSIDGISDFLVEGGYFNWLISGIVVDPVLISQLAGSDNGPYLELSGYSFRNSAYNDTSHIFNFTERLFSSYERNTLPENGTYSIIVGDRDKIILGNANFTMAIPNVNLNLAETPYMTVETDKQIYLMNEDVIISGVVNSTNIETPIYISIQDSNNTQIKSSETDVNLITKEYNSIFNLDGNFTEGLYQIVSIYGVSSEHPFLSATTEFDIVVPSITVNSDKSEYYVGENILISGTMSNIDFTENTDISYEIYANQILIESGIGGTLNEDGTFSFTIYTANNESWDDYSGSVELIVTIQNFTSSTFFTYYNFPNMSNEALYDMIIDLVNTLYDYRITLTSYNNTLTIQNGTIVFLQEEIAALKELHIVIPPTAPILSPIGSQTVTENSTLNLIVTATDANSDFLTITSNATSLSFGEFNDSGYGTATLEFNPGFNDAGVYQINVDVTDGNTYDSEVFTLTVTNVNQISMLAPIGTQTVAENSTLNITVTVIDMDPDLIIITSNATSLSFGEFNDNEDNTASIQFNPSFTDAGVYLINVDVTDGIAYDNETFILNVTNTDESPRIIGLIANDPNNGDDVYDTGDTITILFDSDTNMPGANETIRMPQIEHLFTFSESFGTAATGEWVNASTFVITVRNTNNALITINSTTITPALETLILPIDNNEEDFSTVTSPVLSGDWGIPTQ